MTHTFNSSYLEAKEYVRDGSFGWCQLVVVFTPVGFLLVNFKSSLTEEVRFKCPDLHICMCFPMQITKIVYLWWVHLNPTTRDAFSCRTVGSPLVMLEVIELECHLWIVIAAVCGGVHVAKKCPCTFWWSNIKTCVLVTTQSHWALPLAGIYDILWLLPSELNCHFPFLTNFKSHLVLKKRLLQVVLCRFFPS